VRSPEISMWDAGTRHRRVTVVSGLLLASLICVPGAAHAVVFAATGSMHSPRVYPTATRLPDGRVLIAAGSNDGSNALDSAELYDPRLEHFPSLPTR
jgi:hypothetical protein